MQASERNHFQETLKKLHSENENLKTENTAIKIERAILKSRVVELKKLIAIAAKKAVTL